MTIELTSDDDPSKQCLLVSPATAQVTMTPVACDARLEITDTGPQILCVYPRLTGKATAQGQKGVNEIYGTFRVCVCAPT